MIRKVQIVQIIRPKIRIRLRSRLLRPHLGKVIRNCLAERLLFAQKNLEVASGLLTHFLQRKIIQRIIGHQHHRPIRHTKREEQILLGQLLIHHTHRLQFDSLGRHVHDLQLKPAGKRL